jgi:hypothetical protein
MSLPFVSVDGVFAEDVWGGLSGRPVPKKRPEGDKINGGEY